jgi:uncharacterized protein YcfJ
MSKPAVFGIVENETQAQQAVTSLEAAGFTSSDISVLSRNPEHANALEEGLGSSAQSLTDKSREVGHSNATKAPEGTAAGAISGGVLGGIAGWLVGIGALAIPGVGPFIAAGPILAALSGAAIVATAGGLVGALVGFGIPEYEAKLYSGKLDAGHILIGVHAETSDEAKAARTALEQVKAHDIKVTSEVAAK